MLPKYNPIIVRTYIQDSNENGKYALVLKYDKICKNMQIQSLYLILSFHIITNL